jgi:hypothetical protein
LFLLIWNISFIKTNFLKNNRINQNCQKVRLHCAWFPVSFTNLNKWLFLLPFLFVSQSVGWLIDKVKSDLFPKKKKKNKCKFLTLHQTIQLISFHFIPSKFWLLLISKSFSIPPSFLHQHFPCNFYYFLLCCHPSNSRVAFVWKVFAKF